MSLRKLLLFTGLLFFSFTTSTHAMELKGDGFTLDIDQSSIQSMEIVAGTLVTIERFDNRTVWVQSFNTNPPETILTMLHHYPKTIQPTSSDIATAWLDNIHIKNGTLVFKELLEKKKGIVYGASFNKTNEVTCAYLRGKKAYMVSVHGVESVYTLKSLALDTLDSMYPR
ncbi:MAG: hypothetical protein VB133_07690 [Anaeromusa sp.]|uniref:hypothetical protein n=1 Tax=Anaeromusa sp. TaxID=1872520 RepID=UPI002B1EB6FC|nr:hypothetical protein [Anaeromusa sp.]MEA4834999.1 hypothetical protein [Anaeromusa sp.]